MKDRVLVIGNTVADHVFKLPAPPERDGKSIADDYDVFAGGQAANAASALALLSVDVTFVGAFGDDAGAELCRDAFRQLGVDLSASRSIRNCRHHTASVLVAEGQRTIAMFRDPRLALDDLEIAEEAVRTCQAVYTDGHEIASSIRLGRLARALGVPLVIDLESAGPQQRELVELATHVIAPVRVLLALTGRHDPIDAMRSLQTGPQRAIVATLGSEGAVGIEKANAEPVTCPASPCRVVDTTGAGDAFHAGYLAALLKGADFANRLHYAAKIAAAKCEIMGPRLTALPDWAVSF